MKRLITFCFMLLTGLDSCNRPETTVINFIRSDGSVLREIIMRHNEKKFHVGNVQVPYDTTWKITDTLEINSRGDSLWVRKAEKLFRNSEELNKSYECDSSFNREEKRRVEFKRYFRWFTTGYRFAEIIESRIKNGYPVSDFMEKDELEFFFTPGKLTEKLLNGPDSLRYKAIEENVNTKTGEWIIRSLVAEWMEVFNSLVKKSTSGTISFDSLRMKEDTLYKYVRLNEGNADSLWNNRVTLQFLIGEEYASRFSDEADSALNYVQNTLLRSFSSYTEKTLMPGRLTGTSGFKDSLGYVHWQVKSDYFMTEPYVMWAESEKTNIWAWVITVALVLVLIAGLIIRISGKMGRRKN